jgi:hypothetical protein
MKRLREVAQEEEDALPVLPAEVWHHVTTFMTDEKDYKSLALAVPELGRYVLRNSGWLVSVIKAAFGHLLSFREPPFGRRPLPIGPINREDMDQLWLRRGLLHRLDGPAVRTRILHAYYSDGLLHCANGPALRAKDFAAWYDKGELTKVIVRGPFNEDEFVPDASRLGHPLTRNVPLVLGTRGKLRYEGAHRSQTPSPLPVFRLLRTGERGTLERVPIPMPNGIMRPSMFLLFCPLTE